MAILHTAAGSEWDTCSATNLRRLAETRCLNSAARKTQDRSVIQSGNGKHAYKQLHTRI